MCVIGSATVDGKNMNIPPNREERAMQTKEPAKSISEFLPVKGLLESLGISRDVLYAWIDAGLPHIKIGQQLYFREVSVAGWLGAQEKVKPSDG